MKRILLGSLLPSILLSSAISNAYASENYPNRNITIVVPYSPGGGVDITTRLLTPIMSQELGQSFIVDNRPGGGTNIGMSYVARSKPDGYTLYMASNTLTANKALYSQLNFDPESDFTPVGKVGYAPLVVVVKADSKYEKLMDLIEHGKNNPGQLSFGTAGVGSSGHLASELLLRAGDFKAEHIPYKGGANAITDLLGGRLDFMSINPLEVIPHIQSGQLRALAVLNKEGTSLLPSVPTAHSQGLSDVNATVWWGIVAPAGTPENILNKLNTALNTALADTEVQDKLAALGAEPEAGTATQFQHFIQDESRVLTDLITSAGIKAN